ncbi:DUF6879 family protein [Streptomyces tsukubensis]
MTNPVLEGLAKARRSAVHLEMRDAYQANDPGFIAWQNGKRLDPTADRSEWWRPFLDVVTETTARGVIMVSGLLAGSLPRPAPDVRVHRGRVARCPAETGMRR